MRFFFNDIFALSSLLLLENVRVACTNITVMFNIYVKFLLICIRDLSGKVRNSASTFEKL